MWRLIAVLTLSTAALAQTPVAADAARIAAQQFGPAFTVVSNFAPITGDLDADGAEDLVLVATAREPLLDQMDFHYKVIDPYNAYFGIGDPKITLQFAVHDGSAPRVLLVVHDWRAETPKAKFVIVNLPFEHLAIARTLLKKKVVQALRVEETSGITATVYWTGKKYNWRAQ